MARKRSVTKNSIRQNVGRGKFRLTDLAEALGVSYATAYASIRDLAQEGQVEEVGQEKVTAEDGTPGRGRPRTLYRVV